MAQNTSSAVPEQLIRYSEVTTEMDYALQSTARQLRSQLDYFENRCSEPGMRLSAVYVADGLKNYADQCEPIDLWVKKVGQQFQLADGRWGIASSGVSGGWLAGVWASLSGSLSAISVGARAGFAALLAIPDWLREKVASLPWTSQDYSEWMPDITKSIELLGRYIAERFNIQDADFDPSDVALFLFSESSWCSEWLKEKLEDVDDLKTAYGLIFKFSEANFMFFMAGILSNPARYIDPWLDKVNYVTTHEIPRWIEAIFEKAYQEEVPDKQPGSVPVDSTMCMVETSTESTNIQMPDLTNMSLLQRRRRLEQIQAEMATFDQELFDLRALGASDQLGSSEIEQQIATLRQEQTDLQSEADDWRNKIRISSQGLKWGFDDRIPDAPWQTRSDDFEREVDHLSEEIAKLESLLPHQREFDRTFTQLQEAERARQEVETSLAERWWNNVPARSQQTLTYKGQETDYGCTPASTSMILDYWHTQDTNNKTMSAQELLNLNVTQGKFTATGMSATQIHDEVQNLGYGVVEDYIGSDFETLRQEVEKGPVVAIVKLHMATSGENHALVVTGISPDGSQVRVNDPWTGESRVYAKEQFTQSWGSNFGSGVPINNFVVIRPS